MTAQGNPIQSAPSTASAESVWQSTKVRRLLTNLVLHALVIAGAVVLTIPLMWLVSTSFKDTTLIFSGEAP